MVTNILTHTWKVQLSPPTSYENVLVVNATGTETVNEYDGFEMNNQKDLPDGGLLKYKEKEILSLIPQSNLKFIG